MTSAAHRQFLPGDPNLAPVPGRERARWLDTPTALAARPDGAAARAIVAEGEADALVVQVAGAGRALVQRVRGAFARAVPSVEQPMMRVLDELVAEFPELASALDLGEVPAPGGGAFVVTPNDTDVVIGHRSRGSDGRAVEIGRIARPRPALVAVAPSEETLWLGITPAVETDEARRMVNMIRVILPGHEGAGVFSFGEHECLPGLHPIRLLAHGTGDLWLVLGGASGPAVQLLGGDSAWARGRPWFLPFTHGRRGARACGPWTRGFAVAIQRDPMVVAVSDGEHTTRVRGDIAGDPSSDCSPALLASRDGSLLLVAYDAPDGPRLARATIDPADTHGEADPWEIDRATAAEPLPAPEWPPRPGPPEVLEVQRAMRAAPPLVLWRRYVRQARLRTVLAQLGSLRWPEHILPGTFVGYDLAGHHAFEDGCGNRLAMDWSSAGIVAVVSENTMVPFDRDGIATLLNTWCPERHLARVPANLEPLGWRALALAEDGATGCIWIATGPDARWGASGHGLDMLDGYALAAEEAPFGSSMPQDWLDLDGGPEARAQLAIRLADGSSIGPVTLTPEDEEILFEDHDPDGEPPEPGSATEVARGLATLGIHWTDPEGAWARLQARRQLRSFPT